jgi:hypothetical protein
MEKEGFAGNEWQEDSALAGVEGCHSQHTPKGRAFRVSVRPSTARQGWQRFSVGPARQKEWHLA